MRSDILAQIADYRGVVGWNAFTEPYNNTARPAIEVPLYIKEHPIPSRRPKITELASVSDIDSASGFEVSQNYLFRGAPDALQVTISGWTITPMVNSRWDPKDINGNSLNIGDVSYPEIISAYIEGRMNKTLTGGWQRKDPDYYVTPYGQKYTKPIVNSFDPSFTTNPRKHSFSMSLILEW